MKETKKVTARKLEEVKTSAPSNVLCVPSSM
jgi:hypothetical protein